ncbi:integral membrane protein [Fusarium beomiforme]|uniref:Integral membrane protein n=1 Tax=Fusarium beomiforme TaxID=44412 RepID=A0A9P5DRA4_9HYPO|nr:integral membrane protein [Fusarium beomiforme]
MVIPAMEPPAGYQSNFNNPNRAMYYICIVSNAIAMPICSIFVILRLWIRYRLSMQLQADDSTFRHACNLSHMLTRVYSCLYPWILLKYGGGLHQWDVPDDLMSQYHQTVYATMVNYGPTVFAIKAAILLFLVRIFSPYKTYVKWIHGFLGFMAVYYVVMLFLKIFICRPIPMFWGATSDGKCLNQRALILTDNIISLLSDILILLLPCPLTKKLHLGIKAKLKIIAVFGMGGLACIFSLIRLVFIIKDGKTPDQTYKFIQINLTGIAECGIGVVCACLPLMPMLWKSILHNDKPGYSSNARSQFEMMNSSQKRSQNAARNQTSIHHIEAADSDENILITPGKSYITTKVGGRDDITDGGSAGGDSAGLRASLDQTRIYRTVEFHQYEQR